MTRSLIEPTILIVNGEDDFSLTQSYLACLAGNERFLALKISWDDYLDILEFYGVDLDEYLGIVEENLSEHSSSL